jgi:arsenate reductase
VWPDPAAVEGDAEKSAAFRETLAEPEARIKLFVNIPIESLDRLALHEAVRRSVTFLHHRCCCVST